MTSPPPTTIYGELTADENHIVIMFIGPDEDLEMAGGLLNTIVPHFSVIKDEDGVKVPNVLQVPTNWPAIVQLAGTFGASWQTGPALTEWIGRELTRRMNVAGGLTVDPPHGLVPYSWQISGARLIAATGSAYLNDEAGTGKTISTVLGLVEMAAAGQDVFPVVVICPASVTTHWVREFRRVMPWVRAVEWRGKNAEFRRKMIGHHDVYVVSYETARRDARDDTKSRSPLVWVEAKTIVADESQRIKDSGAAQTKATKRLARKAVNFIGLTGTPIAKSTRDIAPTLEALNHHAWPSAERLEDRFCAMDHSGSPQGQAANLGLRPEMEAQFWDCLLGQYRRVAKADVLAELPPKVYTVEFVDVPEPWRTVYDNYEQDMLTELPDGEELSVLDVLAQFGHLSQLASSPGNLRISYTTELDPISGLEIEKRHQHIDLKDDPAGWKIDKLMEILARYPGQPVATLAPSRQLMVLAGARAERAGYRVGYIVGGQSKRARNAAIDGFQAGDLDLICVSTKAGGVGLTLTAASVAVFLQRPWSYIESSQAEDRFHRIGAEVHDQIDIWDIVATNTIESRVRQVLKQRAGAFSEFVKDPRIVAECLGGASVTRIHPRKAS